MHTILLIGGLSSGKSTVSSLFCKRGAKILDLDVVGHEVLNLPPVVDRLRDSFGEAVLHGEKVQRSALAKVVFSDEGKLERLNSITHPYILQFAQRALQEYRDSGCSLVVVEASAFDGSSGLFDNLLARCDAVVAVVAPIDQRLARAVEKGLSSEDAQRRIDCQPSDSMRQKWADYVIENRDGQTDVDAQIDFIIGDLDR